MFGVALSIIVLNWNNPMSFSGCIDKQIVVQSLNGTNYSAIKENKLWYNNWDESQRQHAEWKKLKTIWFYLCNVLEKIKLSW